ncbi:MAG: hypothetical protein Aurels2KO_49010 [Aureliella sp.]
MEYENYSLSRRIMRATEAVFGDEGPLTQQVRQACHQYAVDMENVVASRGIEQLLIAVVGAKGQGKTWVARQFLRSAADQAKLPSGDLDRDATEHVTWIGPSPPNQLDHQHEKYVSVDSQQMIEVGRPYILVDTPGITDQNRRAADFARSALSLAPIKLLVIARDQVRAASNMELARHIDGAICVPIVSSVEPEEIADRQPDGQLVGDLQSLLQQFQVLAPKTQFTSAVLVPDFEITGDEAAAVGACMSGILDALSDAGVDAASLENVEQLRIRAASQRLRSRVGKLIQEEMPQLAGAVTQLSSEAEQLPSHVLESLLGAESVLETGVRMRLRSRLISDTSLIWFPYRTVLSTLNLTQGAWDRVMLAVGGSIPSLFGALTGVARNVRATRDFNIDLQEGIRKRAQQQVEERLQPLCAAFHRAVMKLRPGEALRDQSPSSVQLLGIEELQTRSQRIFDEAIERHCTNRWVAGGLALVGSLIFWALMASPIVVIYRQYFSTAYSVATGNDVSVDAFPHPEPGMLLVSMFLSIMPLLVYCMVVLTGVLSRRKVQQASQQIIQQHAGEIETLQNEGVIRLQFDDDLLQHAEYLLQFNTP